MPSPLDRFIPQFDVRERFERELHAPADVVMRTAKEFDLQSIGLIRLIIKVRKFILRGSPDPPRRPVGLFEESLEMGWGLLDEVPDREIVCGAHCQPWTGDVVFTPIPPEGFFSFDRPDQVKIAWTLEAEPLSSDRTLFIHEVRAVATDESARQKFRKYWRWARFGITAIRLLLLPAIKKKAEKEWRVEQKKA
ncbi:MAG: hypothetical protein IPM50_03275 [Acidobacteriota bacterium]|nr:MAG: hypothetical protein IPM50_03275 [Acidobacteriota bacterium]